MTFNIQHIVLSGGAHLGLYSLGSLKYLAQHNYYCIENIRSIYGTSIGGLIGAILALNIDWDVLIEYVIKRPWYKMIQLTPTMFLDVIQNKGLLGRPFFENMMRPLLQSKDLDINISLQEFYEYTGIELYLYSVSLNSYSLKELSYKTYPNMPLIDAIYMTCCLPYVFQPVWFEDSYYVDGGLINNYPLECCIEHLERNMERKEEWVQEDTSENEEEEKHKLKEVDTNTILSIKFVDNGEKINSLDKEANIFEYGYFLYKQMLHVYKNKKQYVNIENEVVIPCNEMNFNDGYAAIMNQDERKKYIEQGEVFAKMFLTYKNSNEIQKEDCNENSS